jgi:hypothetical protein
MPVYWTCGPKGSIWQSLSATRLIPVIGAGGTDPIHLTTCSVCRRRASGQRSPCSNLLIEEAAATEAFMLSLGAAAPSLVADGL